MTSDVLDFLSKEQLTPEHEALLSHCKALVRRSRGDMSKKYSDWDVQDLVYRGIRCLDRDDIKAAQQGKPVKMITPNTFAQCQTFISFLFLTFMQNRTFFEVVPTGREDHGTKHMDVETMLQYDLRQANWAGVLYQKLLDTSRFGLGVTECMWTRDVTRAYVPLAGSNLVIPSPVQQMEWQDFVKFEGNRVQPISPYRFFPDTTFPMTEFQRGEFCATEEEFTIGSLKQLESVGEVHGIQYVPPLPRNWAKMRGAETRTVLDFSQRSVISQSCGQSQGSAIVTKMKVRIVPKDFKLDGEGKKTLGPEEFPIMYVIWYANDSRIIRAEPAYAWHDMFDQTVSQFSPDMHHTLNLGLADLIYRLQEVISWLYNSRITDVRRVMRGRNLINPMLVDMKSYDSEGDIYMRSGVNGAMMDRAIMPLNPNEVTSGHVNDAQVLSQVMEVVTGINGNAMGQYSSGRRSARQTEVVTSGSAGRMRMHGQLIFNEGLAPLAMMMTSNSRQQLPEDRFNLVIGTAAQQDPRRYLAFKGTPEEVICNADYFTFDGTLQSEKGYLAQALQELFGQVLANPAAAMQLDVDPRVMLSEIMNLRGAGDVSRFSLAQNVARGAPPLMPPMPEPQPSPSNVAA
jgi:hypothetical protein